MEEKNVRHVKIVSSSCSALHVVNFSYAHLPKQHLNSTYSTEVNDLYYDISDVFVA